MILNMIRRHVPGTDEEKQLFHLIDANTYMYEHDCTLAQALSATAHRHKVKASQEATDQLDHLKRARDYVQLCGGTFTHAIDKTADVSGASRNCLVIAEQLDHIERAQQYQLEHTCSMAEALSLTVSR